MQKNSAIKKLIITETDYTYQEMTVGSIAANAADCKSATLETS